jgi:hypothetical protein
MLLDGARATPALSAPTNRSARPIILQGQEIDQFDLC